VVESGERWVLAKYMSNIVATSEGGGSGEEEK